MDNWLPSSSLRFQTKHSQSVDNAFGRSLRLFQVSSQVHIFALKRQKFQTNTDGQTINLIKISTLLDATLNMALMPREIHAKSIYTHILLLPHSIK